MEGPRSRSRSAARRTDWIVSRSHEKIRTKVRELIDLLKRILPEPCEFVYQPRQFRVLYRGVRCISPYIQQRQIRLQIVHKGWVPGMLIAPETDLDDPAFLAEVLKRFDRTREQIDSLLDGEAP